VPNIAYLNGGGNAAGLDPCTESFTKMMNGNDWKVYGIKSGWNGLLAPKPRTMILTPQMVEGLVRSGGSLIRTSRDNPLKVEGGIGRVISNLGRLEAEGLVAFGGDDTLTVLEELHKRGVKVLGIPKTMDLDLDGTDWTSGFWSYNIALDPAIRGFIEATKAHSRVGVFEVFGRYSGFTAVVAGIFSSACYIGIPEFEVDLDQLLRQVKKYHRQFGWAMVVVSEAVNIGKATKIKIDPHDNELLKERRNADALADIIQKQTKLESKGFQASHPFRGIPSIFDSWFGYNLGIKAAELVSSSQWGKMLSIEGQEIRTVLISSFKPRRIIKRNDIWHQACQLRNSGII
jgi:6-phosphofructokinase